MSPSRIFVSRCCGSSPVSTVSSVLNIEMGKGWTRCGSVVLTVGSGGSLRSVPLCCAGCLSLHYILFYV